MCFFFFFYQVPFPQHYVLWATSLLLHVIVDYSFILIAIIPVYNYRLSPSNCWWASGHFPIVGYCNITTVSIVIHDVGEGMDF